MNLQNLTNSENCEQKQQKQIVDDKSRCKYVSTKGKNVGKTCSSILALESYYEIELCKKHQSIVNFRAKSVERKAKNESKSKELVV
jgi:hypothetical protein